MYYLNLEFQRHSHSPDKIININSVSQIKATTGLVQKSTFYSLALPFLSRTRKTSFPTDSPQAPPPFYCSATHNACGVAITISQSPLAATLYPKVLLLARRSACRSPLRHQSGMTPGCQRFILTGQRLTPPPVTCTARRHELPTAIYRVARRSVTT